MVDTPIQKKGTPFDQVSVEVTVSVGRATPRISELLKLSPNSILPLNQRTEDPVELFIGDRLIARGELIELHDDGDGTLAVRLTEVLQNSQS